MTRDRTSDRGRKRSGMHLGIQVNLRADSQAQIALWDRAVEHAGAFSRADWIRWVVDLAARDELGLEPLPHKMTKPRSR